MELQGVKLSENTTAMKKDSTFIFMCPNNRNRKFYSDNSPPVVK
jgi:hypothetical protein